MQVRQTIGPGHRHVLALLGGWENESRARSYHLTFVRAARQVVEPASLARRYVLPFPLCFDFRSHFRLTEAPAQRTRRGEVTSSPFFGPHWPLCSKGGDQIQLRVSALTGEGTEGK